MTGNKRIAFLCHPYHVGGVTRWMVDAAIAFAQQGWEVYFAAVEPKVVFALGKGRETLIDLLKKGNAPVHIISEPVGREFEFGNRDYCAYVYKRLLQRVPVGTPVILSDDYGIWEAAAFLHLTYPMVGVLHADEEHYYTLVQMYYRQVDLFVCVSERVKRTTLKRFPAIDAATVFTIPCGINLPEAHLEAHTGASLQLVYVGRVSEYQKRTSDLVKVCAQLKQKDTAFHLHIIGDGGERAALEDKFKEAGLASIVTFHGWLEQQEVSKWLADADILVLTSDFEGTPVAMMEALAAGCGIVGTRVSGIEDYEHHPLAADCFAVFEVGDVADAATKIRKIAAIPVSVRQQAARKLAESEFTMQVCLDKYSKALATLKPLPGGPVARVHLSAAAILYSKIMARARHLKVAFTGGK